MIDNHDKQTQILEYCLRVSTFFCFSGWAWGHLYWEPTYSSILWSETTFEWFQKFGYTWEDFAGTGSNDGLIQKCVHCIGWLFFGASILSFSATRTSWIQLSFLSLSSVLMAAVAAAKYIKSEFEFPMLIEHGAQVLSPVLLVMALTLGMRHRATVNTAIIAILMTFAGHGLYAAGVWPTPPTFIGMTRSIFGWDYNTTKIFLRVAGFFDFVVCCGMFIPTLRRSCALYAFFWGLMTAAARPIAGMSWDLNYWGADQFMPGLVYRSPHWFIPLFLFLYWTFAESQKAAATQKSIVDEHRQV